MLFCNREPFYRRHLIALLSLGVSLLGAASAARAAEALPKLQVDPALLGGGASTPAATPTEAPVRLAIPATAPATTPVSATTPVPAVVATPRAIVVAAPARKEVAKVAVAKVAATPVATAKSLPSLLVDPALLGGREATLLAVPAPTLGEPPVVAAQPDLTPTYSAHVAAGVLPGPSLRATGRLLAHATEPGEQLPTFITADNMTGQTDEKMVAEGNVELRRRGAVLKSDRLTQWQATDEVEAEGHVDLTNEGDRIRGPKLRMKLGDNTGFFEQPEYQIRRPQTGTPPILWAAGEEPAGQLTTGQGVASRMDFEGKGKYHLKDATYSTCTPAAGSDPDWFARTSSLRLDYTEQEGVARNATLLFKGVPILYSPWLSFSLNNERKSGLLTPTIGSTTRGGFEFTQPFYWNIAPNMDATIAPRVIAKRGCYGMVNIGILSPPTVVPC
jgi:LPS-assembly protein